MTLTIAENKTAADYISGKAVMFPGTFASMPAEIKSRSFSVAKIYDFDVLRDMRDAIAKLPKGGDWNEIKNHLAADISPWMDDSPEGRKAAESKAELVLRQHGFQAYAASRFRQQQATKDALPYWKYMTAGDDHVRPEHAALDGLILPADDPFWADHYPPWDFGCRCMVVAITRAEADDEGIDTDADADENLNGASADAGGRMENNDRSYKWNPGDLHLDLDGLRDRYGEDGFEEFSGAMHTARISVGSGNQMTAWDWMFGDLTNKDRNELMAHAANKNTEAAILRSDRNGSVVMRAKGENDHEVSVGSAYSDAEKSGEKLRGIHVHPSGDWLPSPADVRMALHPASAGETIATGRMNTALKMGDGYARSAGTDKLMTSLESWQNALDHGRMTRDAWFKKLHQLADSGVIKMTMEAVL